MRIKVLFFGAIADIAQNREIELEVIEETSPESLIDQLTQQHPALAKHKLLIAVNEEYADANTTLKDGDEIAVFTAVSGG